MTKSSPKASLALRLATAGSALLVVLAVILFWWASKVARQAPPKHAGQVITVSIQDNQCQPNVIEVPAGRVTFNIVNKSDRALEWEILDGVMVLEERENIAPGFSQSMTVKLPAGEFDITCGLLSNPRGKLRVTPSVSTAAETAQSFLVAFVGALAEYRVFLAQESGDLQDAAEALRDAIQSGDRAQAQALYGPAHRIYRHIEPMAELFADLDARLNGRADYFREREADPAFSGFHRLEYGLFDPIAQRLDVKAMGPVAEQLVADIGQLSGRLRAQDIPPERLASSAARLLRRVADNLPSDEEDQYAHDEPANLQATWEACRKIADLLAPLLSKSAPDLEKSIEQRFAAFTVALEPYRQGDSYKQEALDAAQRNALAEPIRALAADLAKVNAALGLE